MSCTNTTPSQGKAVCECLPGHTRALCSGRGATWEAMGYRWWLVRAQRAGPPVLEDSSSPHLPFIPTTPGTTWEVRPETPGLALAQEAADSL